MGQSERKESGGPSGRLRSLTALLPTVPEIRYLLARVLLRPPIRTRFIMAWSLFQLPTFSGGVRTHCVVGIGRDSLLGTKSLTGEVPHGRDDQSVVGGRARRMRVRGSAFGPAPAQPHRAHGGRDRGKLAARVPGLGEHEGGLPLLLQ